MDDIKMDMGPEEIEEGVVVTPGEGEEDDEEKIDEVADDAASSDM